MNCLKQWISVAQMGLKKKKIAARKHATPLGAKPPLSLNPRNAPEKEVYRRFF